MYTKGVTKIIYLNEITPPPKTNIIENSCFIPQMIIPTIKTCKSPREPQIRGIIVAFVSYLVEMSTQG